MQIKLLTDINFEVNLHLGIKKVRFKKSQIFDAAYAYKFAQDRKINEEFFPGEQTDIPDGFWIGSDVHPNPDGKDGFKTEVKINTKCFLYECEIIGE